MQSKYSSPTLILVLVLILVTLSFFWPVIFCGKSISRLGVLADLDLMYNPSLKSAELYFPLDPSAPLIHFPNALFIEHWIKNLTIPLWNPLSACGESFVGNIQSFLFSPLHFIFPASNPYLYNLSIVIYILIAATGTYLLARKLALSPYSAALAATAYSLCPHILRYIELAGQLFLYPWIAVLFIHLGESEKPNIKRILLSSLIIALICYLMHPETFIVAIFTAVALSLSVNKNKAVFLTSVFKVGIIGMCLAAPVLLPFFELILDSATYKTSSETFNNVDWRIYFTTLTAPESDTGFGSLSPGLVCLFCFPAALPFLFRRKKILIFLLLIFFVLSTWIEPFYQILKNPPLNYVLANYYMPSLALVTSIVCGFGLNELINTKSKKYFWTCSISGILFVLFLKNLNLIDEIKNVILHSSQIDWVSLFQNSVTSIYLNSSSQATIVIFALVLVYLSIDESWKKFAFLFLPALLILNVISMARGIYTQLPCVNSFSYLQSEVLTRLSKEGNRITALSDRIFPANSNMIYGIRDFRTLQAVWTKRYFQYASALGAKHVFTSAIQMPNQLNRFADMAGIKYILGNEPVIHLESNVTRVSALNTYSGRIAPGIRLKQCQAEYFPAQSTILLKTNWMLQPCHLNRYHYRICLIDENNRKIATSLWHKSDLNQTERSDSLLIPDLVNGQMLHVGIEVLDHWRAKIFSPDTTTMPRLADCVVIADIQSVKPDKKQNPPVELVQNLRTDLFLFKNNLALPQAYWVKDLYVVDDKTQALKILSDPDFNCQTSAVIESKIPDMKKLSVSENKISNQKNITPALVSRINPNTVLVDIETGEKGFLILTDSFYPGWKAYVDEKKVEIFPANLLFRGIELKPGKHNVRFSFEPESFYLGIFIASLSAISILVLLRKKHGQKSDAAP